eukprot:7436156-Alexandrium_andersonii.AAC.1
MLPNSWQLHHPHLRCQRAVVPCPGGTVEPRGGLRGSPRRANFAFEYGDDTKHVGTALLATSLQAGCMR